MLPIAIFVVILACASGLRKPPVDRVPDGRIATGQVDVFNTTLATALHSNRSSNPFPWWKSDSEKEGQKRSQKVESKASHGSHSTGSITSSHQKPQAIGADSACADRKPKVHFLFLVMDDIPHVEHWNAFFKDAGDAEWSAFVHCKSGCNQTMLKKLSGLQAVESVPTYYCHDLTSAMVQLLRGAAKDCGSPRDKFVFLSESTLPVKPFRDIYSALQEHDASDFCIFPTDHWGESPLKGAKNSTAHNLRDSKASKRAVLVKHHQWVVLTRAHANVMVQKWSGVDASGHWALPLRNQAWSDHSVYAAEDFSRAPVANWCTDEWAFFATIFGALIDDGKALSVQIPGFLDKHGGNTLMMAPGDGRRGPNVRLQGTCRTFVFWAETDTEDDMTLLARILASDYPNTKLSCWPECPARPATIERLSDEGLLEFRQSPFLFARKIPSQLSMPKFSQLIFDPTPIKGGDADFISDEKPVKVHRKSTAAALRRPARPAKRAPTPLPDEDINSAVSEAMVGYR